jgi:nucleoside diphosphate kinase
MTLTYINTLSIVKERSILKNGLNVILQLSVRKGYSYSQCYFLIISRKKIQTHYRQYGSSRKADK